MSNILGIPLKIWTKTTYFRRFSTTSQLNGEFSGEYLLNETYIDTKGPLRCPIILWNLIHKRQK